jgi:hypothetical protein
MKRWAVILLALFACRGGVWAAQDDNSGLLKSMLETFLGAGDLTNAAVVARKGALQYPGDIYWEEKTGDIMSWLSKPEEALKYYKAALKTGAAPGLIKKVKTLAVGLKDYETAAYALELELKSGDTTGLNDLVYTYEQLGAPEKALGIIERYGKDEAAGLKAIELLVSLGRVEEVPAKYRLLISRYGARPALLSGYAGILISQRRFNEAFAALKTGRARATDQDEAFWRDLGAAASFSGDNKTALEAARLLRRTGKAGLQEYEIIINSAKASNDPLAGEYSFEAWQKFKKPYLLVQYLSLAVAGQDYKMAAARLRGLSSSDGDILKNSGAFWALSAAVKAHSAGAKEAAAAYRAGVRNVPLDESLRAQFAWFLLDAGLNAELRGSLGLLSTPPPATDELKLALAYACYALNDSAAALRHLRSLASGTLNSRLLEADALDLDGRKEEADGKRLAEFKKLRGGVKLSEEEALTRARLCAAFCSAPQFKKEIKAVKGRLPEASLKDIELSRATLMEEAERAVKLAGGIERKPWLEFYLALLTGDRPRQDALLCADLLELPLRDRVAGLSALGYRKQAAQDIFEHLDKNPGDAALALEAARLFPELSPGLDLGTEIAKRKNLEEITQAAAYSLPLGAYSRLGLAGEHRKLNAPAGGTLFLPKTEYKKTGVVFNTGKDFKLTAQAGFRYEQKDFPYAGLEYQKNIFTNTELGLKAVYAGEAGESVYLLAGALKDALSFFLAQTYPGSITLKVQADDNRFYSQDRNYLGSLRLLNFEASGNCAAYGWRVTPAAKLSFADANPKLDGNYGILNKMVRLDDPNAIPAGYTQYGAGLTLQKNQERVILRSFSPYLSADYYYNTVYKSGGALTGGVFTSLFKRDTLNFYFEYDKGLSGTSDEYKKAGLNWKLFF